MNGIYKLPALIIIFAAFLTFQLSAFGRSIQKPFFTEVAEESGLNFKHFNGMTGKLSLPEIMGSGAALFDYDNDGDLDIFIVQGKLLAPGEKMDDALFPWTAKEPPAGRLFRNDLSTAADGTRKMHFVDVTKESGIIADGYGFGAASGDINNDGFPDLYICNLGSNKLFINNKNGTFTDATGKSGTDDPRWSISGSFVDYDRDGFLDLIVVNYADFNVNNQPKCYAPTSVQDYCGPKAFTAAGNSLFRNRGDGTFENVTVSSGISKEFGHALGVVAADLNDDGWMDLYIANDGDANQVWINNKKGKFDEIGFLSGAAVNIHGQTEASMGVDAADFNGDGTEDIFITHLSEETHTLYKNAGGAVFDDITQKSEIALPSLRLTGFGTGFIDFDNDSVMDIFIANGAVKRFDPIGRNRKLPGFDEKFPLGQTNQLFRGVGNEKFADVSADAGENFMLAEISRGAAFGDIDNDGDTDILVINNSGKARLLLNNVGNKNNWIGLKLLEKGGKRDALGSKAEIFIKGQPPVVRRSRTDGSYASSRDPRILAGLGKASKIEKVRITWASGAVEEWSEPILNNYTTLREGSAGKKSVKKSEK